jgi:hypothetical protein
MTTDRRNFSRGTTLLAVPALDSVGEIRYQSGQVRISVIVVLLPSESFRDWILGCFLGIFV